VLADRTLCNSLIISNFFATNQKVAGSSAGRTTQSETVSYLAAVFRSLLKTPGESISEVRTAGSSVIPNRSRGAC